MDTATTRDVLTAVAVVTPRGHIVLDTVRATEAEARRALAWGVDVWPAMKASGWKVARVRVEVIE